MFWCHQSSEPKMGILPSSSASFTKIRQEWSTHFLSRPHDRLIETLTKAGHHAVDRTTESPLDLLAKLKSLFRKNPNDGEETPLISVVFFMAKRMEFTEDELRTAVVKAIGRELVDSQNEIVVAQSPTSFIRVEGQVYLLHRFSRIYVDDVDQAVAETPDPLGKQAIRGHKAWCSIDLNWPQNSGGKDKAGFYKRMLRIAAELLNSDCLAIYLPETGKLVPVDDGTKSVLRGDKAFDELNAYQPDPVIFMKEDDAFLEAAAQEARTRWPEFTKAFAERKSDTRSFAVKAPFRDGEEVEWMWLEVTSISPDVVEGTLGNRPGLVKNVREGDLLRVPIAIISDWIYLAGKLHVGGFSIPVVREAKR